MYKVGYAQGSNPFYAQHLKREKMIKDGGACEFTWEDEDEEDHDHKCRMLKNHRSAHRCNCGRSRTNNIRDFRNVTNNNPERQEVS